MSLRVEGRIQRSPLCAAQRKEHRKTSRLLHTANNDSRNLDRAAIGMLPTTEVRHAEFNI
ncbi:MAG: hypothetical protein KI793_11000 [Rivularia sp. (in: Bacteria)]|nr:hypothetical protein [Rivularia sp. MS3]